MVEEEQVKKIISCVYVIKIYRNKKQFQVDVHHKKIALIFKLMEGSQKMFSSTTQELVISYSKRSYKQMFFFSHWIGP